MPKGRLPRHIGFIPDGNRRWATDRGLAKQDGYTHGIEPGLQLFDACRSRGVEEVSIYCFTKDNTKRPAAQTQRFTSASVAFAKAVADRGAAVLVMGDENSSMFPSELATLRQRSTGDIKVNLLINYGWEWDLAGLRGDGLRSASISRLDLIVRWGGGRRLSGFLPVQSVYADFYVCDELWPDFELGQFDAALAWFALQDQTLGG